MARQLSRAAGGRSSGAARIPRRTRPGYAAPGDVDDVSQLVGRERELALWRGRWTAWPAARRRFWSWRGSRGSARRGCSASWREARGAARTVWSSPGARRSSSATRPTGCGSMRSTRICRRWTARLRRLAGGEFVRSPSRCPRTPTSSARRRRRLIATSFIARCAACSSGSPARSPLVLCLDDVHWADPASLDLVAALARRPPERARAARGRLSRRPGAERTGRRAR